MVPDWRTNYVFLSDLLEGRHPQVFSDLSNVLLAEGVAVGILRGTADLWCRDYMPVQLRSGVFRQFAYSPDYLRNYEHLVTPAETCRLPCMETCRQSEIILDGGNVVATSDKVIVTDKVFRENPSKDRHALLAALESELQAECIVIPREPYDPIGHADGVVRFLDETTVLMNAYPATEAEYGKRVETCLQNRHLSVERFPLVRDPKSRGRNELPAAVGYYINFLRVGDVFIVPGFGRQEDETARHRVAKLYPTAKVHQVPAIGLAEEGGVLNCVAWTAYLPPEVTEDTQGKPAGSHRGRGTR